MLHTTHQITTSWPLCDFYLLPVPYFPFDQRHTVHTLSVDFTCCLFVLVSLAQIVRSRQRERRICAIFSEGRLFDIYTFDDVLRGLVQPFKETTAGNVRRDGRYGRSEVEERVYMDGMSMDEIEMDRDRP